MLQDIHFSEISSLIYVPGILTCERHFRRSRPLPFSGYPYCNNSAWAIVTHALCIPQAAKDLRASQDTLVDIFDRIEMFFRRLEIYTQLESSAEMMNMIIQIMAELISVLGIATKEIKRGRISRYLLHESVAVE